MAVVIFRRIGPIALASRRNVRKPAGANLSSATPCSRLRLAAATLVNAAWSSVAFSYAPTAVVIRSARGQAVARTRSVALR